MPKLTVLGENLSLANKVQVDIVTAADPHPVALLFARECIKQHEDVARAFSGGRVDKDILESELRKRFPEEEAYHIPQVVQYLADEYEQIGQDGSILLLSPETGHALAKLTPDDFYVPAPVPREDGRMVERAPQVKPEVMAAIMMHYHDKDRDSILQNTMLSKVPNVDRLPVEAVKRRTLSVTQRGRKTAAALVHQALPELVENARGVAKGMFDFFPRVQNPIVEWSGDPLWEKEIAWTAEVRVGVQDPTTQNLNFDLVAGSSAAVTTSWARSLGYDLLTCTPPCERPVATLEDLSQSGFYVAGPETSKRIQGRTLVVNAPEGRVIYLSQEAGYLFLQDYETQYREVHDKWVVKCTALGVLYVDWNRVRVYTVEVEETDPVVEIVN